MQIRHTFHTFCRPSEAAPAQALLLGFVGHHLMCLTGHGVTQGVQLVTTGDGRLLFRCSWLPCPREFSHLGQCSRRYQWEYEHQVPLSCSTLSDTTWYNRTRNTGSLLWNRSSWRFGRCLRFLVSLSVFECLSDRVFEVGSLSSSIVSRCLPCECGRRWELCQAAVKKSFSRAGLCRLRCIQTISDIDTTGWRLCDEECPATEITRSCTKWNYVLAFERSDACTMLTLRENLCHTPFLNWSFWFNRFRCLGLLGFQPIAMGCKRGGTGSMHDMHGVGECAFHEAFRIASSGRPGPCHIDLPKECVDEMQPSLAQPHLSNLYFPFQEMYVVWCDTANPCFFLASHVV